MYFRQDRKWKTETLSLASTWAEELPSAGVLDCIMLTVRVKNNSTMYSVAERKPHDHITSIVVKASGTENFKDVHGRTVIAEYMVQYGTLPPNFIDEMSANYSTETFPVLFGRSFQDGGFGLNLGEFDEIRLEVTNDWVSTDVDSSVDQTMDVDLWFLEDAPTPTHFIGTSEVSKKTWTAASQEKTFKVPTKYKVRRLFLDATDYPSAGDGAPSNKTFRNLRYLKYSYNSGKKPLRDDDLYRHDQDHLWGYPDFCHVHFNVEPRVDYYIDTLLARPVTVNLTPSYSADPGADYPPVFDQRMERWLKLRRMTAGVQGRLYAAGYGPLSHLCLHEDQPDKFEGYLDPETLKDVEVTVGNSTSGATSGTVRFITEHLRANKK